MRRGAAGSRTLLFDSVDHEMRHRVETASAFSDDEQGVVLGVEANGDWYLITTCRVVISAGTETRSISYADICDASPVLNLTAYRKAELTQLALRLCDGRFDRLTVEAGLPFIGIWNLLKYVSAQTGKASECAANDP